MVARRLGRPVAAAGSAAALWTCSAPAQCDDKDPPHPPRYPFWVKSIFHAHEIPSVRRGYEVYRQVCATCHSMKQLHFRHLVNQAWRACKGRPQLSIILRRTLNGFGVFFFVFGAPGAPGGAW